MKFKKKIQDAIHAINPAPPATDFEEKLTDLGVTLDQDAETSALVAIKEAQAYTLELANKLEQKQKTVESLQKQLISQQEDMQQYVDQGANDQLFYLTEFLQQRFPHDIDNGDVVVVTKRLLKELSERRKGSLPSITKRQFLDAFDTAILSLESDAEDGLLKENEDHYGQEYFSWPLIQERIRSLLGLQTIEDMRDSWLPMTNLVRNKVRFYNRRRQS